MSSVAHHKNKRGTNFRHDDIPRVWYSADFETNTTAAGLLDNPVWAWGVAEVGSNVLYRWGTTIHSFMQWLRHDTGFIGLYFHNLSFDGHFILAELLRMGFRQSKNTWHTHYRKIKSFTALRNNSKIYEIQFAFENGMRVMIRDSLNLIPMSVRKMARAFGLAMSKGEIDYSVFRGKRHKLTPEELDYLTRDIVIVAQSISLLTTLGADTTKLTAASDAYGEWWEWCKQDTPTAEADYATPENEEWEFAKEAYAGGISLVNSKYQGYLINKPGRVYDVNSMYPAVMLDNPMPYGAGTPFTGKPRFKRNRFYIFRIRCHMELKHNQQPVYRPKHHPKTWPQGTHLKSTRDELGEPITITISSVDWVNYRKHYTIDVIEWLGGYEYQTRKGVFDRYIKYWAAIKVKAGEEGNKPLKQLAKLRLNSLYGKFGQSIDNEITWICSLDDKGVLKWHSEISDDDGATRKYIPMACAITSYSRAKLCDMIRRAGDRFVYCDTDSVHILGDYPIKGIKSDPNKLGYWDCESHFTAGKWMRSKAYAECIDGKWAYKLAGCPASAIANITDISQFEYGAKYSPKLVPKAYPRGILLIDVGYEFKDNLKYH